MTDIEVVLTNLGEIATREIAKSQKPYGLEQKKELLEKVVRLLRLQEIQQNMKQANQL